jgi:hypothetical protein
MAVLGSLRETPQPNEEEIARRLGLACDQVKYAIERIREEFNPSSGPWRARREDGASAKAPSANAVVVPLRVRRGATIFHQESLLPRHYD